MKTFWRNVNDGDGVVVYGGGGTTVEWLCIVEDEKALIMVRSW